MSRIEAPQLYKKYFIDKADERKILFEKLNEIFRPREGLYPGSFVHVTPSFYIENMTYIDADKRVSTFFNDENLLKYVGEMKNYNTEPKIRGFQSDYSKELPIKVNSFDIMFSFYAGFISQVCKKYLMESGILVCNNSHGDASLAYCDEDYSLIGVINRRGDSFSISENKLDSYFIKKDGSPIDVEKVLRRMIGESFTKKGWAYIFRYSKM